MIKSEASELAPLPEAVQAPVEEILCGVPAWCLTVIVGWCLAASGGVESEPQAPLGAELDRLMRGTDCTTAGGAPD